MTSLKMFVVTVMTTMAMAVRYFTNSVEDQTKNNIEGYSACSYNHHVVTFYLISRISQTIIKTIAE